jgi:hypothetical protein
MFFTVYPTNFKVIEKVISEKEYLVKVSNAQCSEKETAIM